MSTKKRYDLQTTEYWLLIQNIIFVSVFVVEFCYNNIDTAYFCCHTFCTKHTTVLIIRYRIVHVDPYEWMDHQFEINMMSAALMRVIMLAPGSNGRYRYVCLCVCVFFCRWFGGLPFGIYFHFVPH